MSEAVVAAEHRPTLLVLASTYPRWVGDTEPGFVHELARRLTGQFRVIVLGPHAPGAKTREALDGVEVVRYRYAPERLETLVNHGGIITNLGRSRWKWLLVPTFIGGQLVRALQLVRVERVDVVHAHWLLPQGMIAWVLRRLSGRKPPFVVTSHGADLFALKAALPKYLKRIVMRDAAAVTVVSEAMREKARIVGGPNLALRVQPMGVDLRQRFVPDKEPRRLENELLFVGRLVEKKGLRYLLDAMPAVVARFPEVSLRVAGFGPDEAALKRHTKQLGLATNVQFIGAVPQADLPELYRRAALFVAPFVEAHSGDQEGLGLVLVEAIGCGCPVIAGDVSAVRDVLTGGGHRIGDVRDTSALSAAILEALAYPRQRQHQAEALRVDLVERFDWKNVAKGYAGLLSTAASWRGCDSSELRRGASQ